MTTFRANFTDLLEPILKDVQSDKDFPRKEQLYTKLYDKITSSRKATETIFEWAGLGDFQEKPEGQPLTSSDPISGSPIKFTHIRRGLTYFITQEMLDHDLFSEIRTLEQDLQISGNDDLEVRGHLILNSGFGTTNSGSFLAAGYDSLALFSTAHTRIDGGATQRNRPSSDANLSWTSLADGRQQFQLWRDNRGKRIISIPQLLIVNPQDELTAMELMKSQLKPGTPNNEINAIMGDFDILVTPFLTDTNAWYLKAADADAIWFWDVQPRTASLRDDDRREISGRKRVQGW
ncbi:hypothetical protein LCGC14_3018220, partial [marine sediment metagenome]